MKSEQANVELKREYVTNMSPEARAQMNEAMRDWRRKNPDKIKLANAKYWERKATKYDAAFPDVFTNNFVSRIAELRNQGFSLREIGIELGISHMKVSRIIKGL